MDNQNIDKLAIWLNACISSNGHDIQNPTYTSLYFDVFFDEISENNTPPHGDLFIDELIDMTQPQSKQKLEDFQKIWNGWVVLYRELSRRELMKD